MPKKPFEQLPDRKRKAIFKVCCELFSQNGYSNTSMKMITRRLRVADGFLYYYFDGKIDIARWIIFTGTKIWHEHYQSYVETKNPGGLFDLFKLSVFQMLLFSREHPEIYGAYTQMVNEPKFPLASYLVEQISWIDHIYIGKIEKEMSQGHMRSDVPADLIAMLLDIVNTRLQEFAYNPKLDPIGVSSMDEKQLDVLMNQLVSLLRQGVEGTMVANPN